MKLLGKFLKYTALTIPLLIIALLIWVMLPNEKSDFNTEARASTQYWQLPTGSNIAYTHVAAQTDTVNATVVYLHGGPGGYIGDNLIELYEDLSGSGIEAYLYDQIGCGLSQRLADPSEYSVERHAEDLRQIIEQISPAGDLVLVGQSWGGFLAAYFAAKNPGLVDKLVLTSPGEIKPVDTLVFDDYADVSIPGITDTDLSELKSRLDRINSKIESEMSLRTMAQVAVGVVTGSNTLVSDEKMDGIFHDMSKTFVKGLLCDSTKAKTPTGRPGMYCQLFTNRSYDAVDPSIRNEIRQIDATTLVLKGECDYIDWQLSYEYVDLIPDSSIRVVERAGHSITTEQPEAYKQEILAFLRPELAVSADSMSVSENAVNPTD